MIFAWNYPEVLCREIITMTWLVESIKAQRAMLASRLELPMSTLAEQCARHWHDREQLDVILRAALMDMPVCRLLYAIGTNGQQMSSNVGRQAIDREKYGQNLAHRPYLLNAIPYKGFLLSDVYLSPPDQRSCV